jgi:hypothetical protein
VPLFLETLGVIEYRTADVVADVDELVGLENGLHGHAPVKIMV